MLAYADDAFFFGPARVVKMFLNFLEGRLELVWKKSHAWIPSFDLLKEQAHEARLFERMPRSRYGIKALGSAADGEVSVFIGEQTVFEPTEMRAQHVTRLCEELQRMLTVETTESPHHALWLLLTKSAAR